MLLSLCHLGDQELSRVCQQLPLEYSCKSNKAASTLIILLRCTSMTFFSLFACSAACVLDATSWLLSIIDRTLVAILMSRDLVWRTSVKASSIFLRETMFICHCMQGRINRHLLNVKDMGEEEREFPSIQTPTFAKVKPQVEYRETIWNANKLSLRLKAATG